MDKRLLMPNHLAQFALRYTLDGQEVRNVLYARLERETGGVEDLDYSWADSDADHQAHVFAQAFKDHLAPFMSTLTTLYAVDWVWNEAVTTGPLHEGSTTAAPLPWSGTNGGEPLPNNVTLAINLGTGLGGRANHGRFFLPGMNDGLTDATHRNGLKASAASDFAAALPALRAQVNNNTLVLGTGNVYTWVVASFVLHNANRAEAVFRDVTAVSLRDTRFDSQRRRLPGRGS